MIGGGLEFVVHVALSRELGWIVLRTPRQRYFANANDPWVDSRALLQQEFALMNYLRPRGIPVARPHELALNEEGVDVLIAEYVEDDGNGFDGESLGRALATLHTAAPPYDHLAAQNKVEMRQAVSSRLARRWQTLRRLDQKVPELLGAAAPSGPDGVYLGARLRTLLPEPGARQSLLHLDVREANIRCCDRVPRALLDWSNALVGDPALEIARIAEFALLAENRLDLTAILAGYSEVAPIPIVAPIAELVYRLDALAMLGLVFLSEAPDADRARQVLQRLVAVHQELCALTR